MAASSTPALPRDNCARFDIPPGHNLQNIDQLILEATKDEEIKELKDQKRRLRNKKAAYDTPDSSAAYRPDDPRSIL
jgi:hypothetical protein